MKTFLKIVGLNTALIFSHLSYDLFIETGHETFAIITMCVWICVGFILVGYYLSLAEKYIDPVLDRIFSKLCKTLFG